MTPEQMKRARNRLKLSQRAIAERLGLSERFWLYREKGEKTAEIWLGRAIRDLLRFPHRDTFEASKKKK